MRSAVASRYARALTDAVIGAQFDPNQALRELRAFEELVRTSPELRNVLLSPAVSISRKRAVLARLGASLHVSPLIRNFLFVMIDRRRAGLLKVMPDAFEAALDERFGIVPAQVTSAAPLNDRQRAELERELAKVAGRKVRCRFNIDPALIGGVVARIGSTVYDGSVRTQLDTLRERLSAR